MGSAAAVVREFPIPFMGRLVLAILAGKKTETRRVIEKRDAYKNVKPGDRLWVRETWCPLDREGWWRMDEPADRMFDVGGVPRRNGVAYRSHCDADSERCRVELGYKWKPSIHMPRWASRVLLEVTEPTRVERIQDIETEGCYAEGIARPAGPIFGSAVTQRDNARGEFRRLWDEANTKREGGRYTFERNPRVRVIAFRRVDG